MNDKDLPLPHSQGAAAPGLGPILVEEEEDPRSRAPAHTSNPDPTLTGHPACWSPFPPTAEGMSVTSFPPRLAHSTPSSDS